MSSSKKESAKTQFFNIEVQQTGPMIRGWGPETYTVDFFGEKFADFLNKLSDQIDSNLASMEKAMKRFNFSNLSDKRNRVILSRLISTANWAYNMSVAIRPYGIYCVNGPTDPLNVVFIDRLERFFCQCLGLVIVYGNTDEVVVARTMLMTDFEFNGGIDHKTNGCGHGFNISLTYYYLGFFHATKRETQVYERFGDLIESIAKLISKKYPAVCVNMFCWIGNVTASTDCGFGRKDITSEAKTELLKRFEEIAASLGQVQEQKIG